MRADRVRKTRAPAFLLTALFAWLTPSLVNAAIVHEGTFTADSASPPSVTSLSVTNVTSGTDQLYVAAISYYGDGSVVSLSSVSGGGLTWTLQKKQCSRRLNRAFVEVWQAFGSPGASFNVDVTLSGNAVVSASVSRYSGADSTTPTEGADGSNTAGLGVNAICDGFDEETAALSLSLTSSNNDSVLFVASHPRNKSITAADADYTQRAAILNSDGGNGAYLYVHDRTLATAGTDSADHTIGSITGWDMAGLVINPASSGSLVGHWNFNEGTGQTAADGPGTNDGTLGFTASVASDDPAWACSNTALDFDGSNDEVKLSSVNIGDSAAWSISAWIKMGADTADKRTIYGEGNTAQTEYLYLQVAQGGSNVTFYSTDFGGSNFAQLTGTTSVEDDAWHLVTVVQRSKTDRELYVGTNSEDTSVQNAGTLSFNTASIGFLRTDWTADPFKGIIDDVRFYDYALSTGEIATLNTSPPAACGATPAVTTAVAEISPTDVTTSSTGNSFSYDIQATISGAATGVNRVAITVPGAFGAPTVTAVQDDGVGVAFTDNTVGNAISVDLTTKITASSKITVLFDSDAPTTQDLTGVDFTSTVDDHTTGDAAQSTTEGNGDGDAGDSNTWTVTTTDAAGGACPIDKFIAVESDDAEEPAAGGTVDLTSSDLELIADGGDQQVGLRFVGLNIDQGATITNAYVEFTAQEAPKANATNLTFYAEDTDSAVTFSNTAPDKVTTRTKTTASVTWSNVPSWDTNGAQYQSPDISSVIQEVVDRGGWTNNNDLVIIVTGTTGSHRVADAHGTGTNVKLHVECETPAVTSAVAEISPNDVTTSSTGNSFSYDIQATIGGSDTGVNRVAITVPASFGAPTITGVQVDGVGAAYTNNTSGNAISVDLTTKVTTSSKITILFDSDAPTTQDLTGVDFTSTVDDSGTAAVAAQSTTEGNGDGDAGDANSWTVTTTDAAGGSCIAVDGTASTGSTETNSLTISHTTSGNDRLMLVGVSIDNNASETVTSVTYNSIALTLVGQVTYTNDARVEIWRLTQTDGLPTGTYNVDITFSADLNQPAIGGVMTFTGVDQTTPLGTFASNFATSNAASVTVSSAANELVFAVMSGETVTSVTTDAPATERWNLSAVGSLITEYGAGATDDGAASVNMSWSLGSSDYWAAGGVPIKPTASCDAAVTSAVAEISPNDVTTSSTGNSFSYDIQATIGGSDTGVNRVAITVPGSFGAPTVTAVQDDGVGVAFTDNTVGNAISVDLTTKITASSKLTVLFNADAPTTQDLTGVDFTSTVDDSGTGNAAQATTEGNGDGNAGDNNSWTVTTTDPPPLAVTSAVAEITPNDVFTNSTGNSFTYDIQATIGGSDTGVNRVAITVPGTFGAPTVTDVLDDGVSVAYTDNTAGNAISVDLTTKITASSKITVLFDSDAPTTQDLTGVDFTSTVDDSGTGDAAQATTEGDGDGDAGDNNSWTVTTTDGACNVLMIVGDDASPSASDQSIASYLVSNNFAVFYEDDGDSTATFNSTISTNSITSVYISESSSSAALGTNAQSLATGVVTANNGSWTDMLLGSPQETSSGGTDINVVDNSHYITSPFATGNLTIYTSSGGRAYTQNPGSGGQVLAQDPGNAARSMILAYDSGSQLQDSSAAPARRVGLFTDALYSPWNASAQSLMLRSLQWVGACNGAAATPAVTSAVAEITPNDVVTSSTGNSFTYDIQATIGGSDTGVNRVTITVPGTFGAPTVTAVQDDGVGVAYTDNTAGNEISVDLTTKVTASSKLTVLFTADAPISQDLVGVSFLSTVDDTGTIDVAQSTTEGNGDGDAGDNNSWTVTTTNGGAGSLIGHWQFNDGSGQTAADSSASSNNGTLGTSAGADSADPAWVCSGTALEFDGSNDEVQLGSTTVGDSAAWSITAWIKMSADTADQRTIYAEGDTAQTEYLFMYVDDTTNTARFYSEDNPGTNFGQLQGTSNVEDDAWHMITVVQRSKTDRELYVDGISEDTDTNNAGTYVFNTSSIGFLRTDWTADPFLGTIDDVRIYDYALTTGEISSLAASPPTCGGTPAVTSAVAEISPNDVITSSAGNSFSYDIQATISGSATGVNRVAITVPVTFGAPTVTDVLDDGVSVAYTDNTLGNAISVDLTTKITASSKITVLFNANAPTTQDLTGVDFISTVDDSGTGDAAQATTEGNGDGDSGDNNSWTVTTTDGACPAVSTIFSDNFEAGNLNLWDTVSTGTGSDSMAPSTLQANSGIYSARAEVDNVSNARARVIKNFAGKTTISGRAFFYLDPTWSTTGQVELLYLIATGQVLTVEVQDDMTLDLWNNVANESYPTTATLTKGAWHSLEIQAVVNGAASEARLWLDDTLIMEQTSINLGSDPITQFNAGYHWAQVQTEANILYVDDAVLCDVPIGATGSAVTSAVAEITPNDVVTSSTGNAFTYDIQATISGSDTGVNRAAITVPAGFSNVSVTGVQVDGVGVAYTDNTVGNAISVDLTTKVTASSKLTVLFTADAPTSQDLIGVDFTSTVDDSITGAAAQATTEGNGDGDAGDNNSWTVTTTNAPVAVSNAVAEISPNDVATSSVANSFSYDIQATIGGGDTGVNRVAITVPGTFGAPTITGVQVDGSGVAYTDNTAGNAISVDLTTKVTATSKITVLFDADAPTTQDLTGVSFTSTVDDSGTGQAAQATSQGNGDGDAADNNSWVVTTTDGAGAIAYYNFNEGSGQTAADSSGNGYDGTLGNAAGADAADPAWECVAGGYALNFDGTNDIVDVGSPAGLDDLGPLTIAAWIKPDSAGAAALMHVMSKSDTGTGRWMLEIDNTGEDDALEFNKDYDSTDVFRVTSNGTVAYDVWQHVAVTWDGSATGTNIHIYKDGVETGYQSTNNGSTTQQTDAALPFNIGNRGDGTDPFYGVIDEVRVYDRILSSGEIGTLAATAPTACATPAVTSAVAEISPNDVTTSSTGNSFSYDIQATIGGGDTGVNRVAITVPSNFGAPTVTDVLVDDVSVAYTNNTVGNAISVDLTTKVTATSKITVLFSADAPTTQDLTGSNFLSTVDDSGTGDAAQNTTEGNGDGDAGDNNSWTVTTTDAAGGACVAFDAASTTSIPSTSPNPMTFSHTTSGSDRLLLVSLAMQPNNDDGIVETVTGITYGGQALTLVGTEMQGADNARIEIWRLINPPTGSNTVSITFNDAFDDAANGEGASAGAASFTGVHQTTPLGTFVSTTNSCSTCSEVPTINVSSATGELVFDTVARKRNPLTMDPGQTELWHLCTDGTCSDVDGGASTKAGAASVTMTWTPANTRWAIGAVPIKPSGGCNAAVTSAVAEISPNDVATSSTGNAFSYDIYATISGGDSGVNVISITVPGSFGVPTVSDVLVNSVSVPYTDNTSGNAISVVLTTKITVTNRITVLFDADAPTTQDLTGVDFVSTVDDNGTSDSPQATTEGNGDADAGDNNSWTVTTTDGGGGGADPVVNSTGDASDANAGNGVCDTGGLNSQSNTECTLRAAIQEANASVGLDSITFNMPTTESGYSATPLSYTITPASALPAITEQVVMDGSTQTGFPGTPIVVLDGNNLAASGLTLDATGDSSTIRGFVIRDFGTNGIQVQAGSDGHLIAGNYIGRLNVSGTDAGVGEDNAGRGIEVLGSTSTIGGTTAADRNVISGNGGEGIIIRSGAASNIVRGNYLGVAADGTTALGNGQEGIQIDTGSPGTIIGGSAAGAGNVIGANGISSGAAVSIGGDGSDNTVVQGNYIGTDAGGTLDLGNIRSGVEVRGTDNAATSPLNTLIGGTGAGEGNIIRYNDLDGVRIRNVAVDVAILGNSIYDSSQQGIDLWAAASNDNVTSNDSGDGDSGANYLMNFPAITSAIENAGNIDVNFDLDVTAGNYRVEFFKNPSGADPSGNGEGQTYIDYVDIAHGGTGPESFATSFSGALGDVLSATATEKISGPAFRNTSEFSATYTVTAGTAVVDAVAEISPNDVATAGGTYLFEYDIAATIGAANTGVDRVAITVPGSFGVGASPVVNVLVDGVTVAFTDNTVGNAISVDLTTKVTTNARITVVFDAIAPSAQDLVGVDFTSTVDDSVTGDAAQSATEGEGDGDTEDNNSWTVTTTGAGGGGGGSCTAVDGSPSSLVQAGGGSLTISHTTSGTDRLMLVGVPIALGTGETVTSVTYNGDALTFQGSAQGPGNDSRVEIWSRVAPDVGTHDVVVTLSGSTHDGASAGVATFTGVDQVTPLGTFASDSGTGGSASFNVSSAAGDLVFGVVAVDDATNYNLVPGSGQAEHWDLDSGELNSSGTTEDGAASVTTSWTWSGSDDFAAGGISVKAAAGGCDTAVTSTAAEISPNDVITSSTGNAFAYDIQTTVNAGDTGVDRVAITVPGTFGAPTISDVLVDGASVSYTNNTVGNDISVDLTTKVTYSARITVLFTSDAPTTQDLTGKDFLSTVDDSGDATAPQSTTEGNGDGDAGDNNDWTVTTTDGAGASCDIDPNGTYIEAENYTSLVAGADLGTFTVESSQAGYNGTGYLISNNGDTGSPPDDMRADYTVNFTTTGTYYIWIRGYALDSGSDSVWIGLDGTDVGHLNEGGAYNQWIWSDNAGSGVNTINIPTAGTYTINLWVRESGHKVDGIYITQDSGAIPGGTAIGIPTPGGTPGTFTKSVIASADDAEQKVASTFGMDLSSSDLELHNTGGTDGYVGMRWTAVTIPQGATIDSAKIQFHVDEIVADSSVALTVTFRGEDIDNAPTYTSTASNLSDRTETTASVDWAIPTWVTVHDEGAAQLSADLSPIVQEIVDRPGWTSGNALAIMIKAWSGSGKRTVESENGEAANAAELQINYTSGGGQATIIDPSACGGGAGINHFAIVHDGNGINCQAENVTIEAHTSSHAVATTFAGTMVLSTSTNHGNWSLVTGSGSLTSGASGNGVYGFSGTDSGVVTLGLRDTFVETTNIDVSSAGMSEDVTEDPNLVFARSGFNFLADSAKNTIGVQIAGKPSNVAPDVQTLELQAVKTNDDTGQCEAALVGANTIDIGFECEDPTSCATNSLTFDGISVPANDNNLVPTYARVSMDFGTAADTTATFTMTYNDVGKVKLHARNRLLPSGEEMLGGSNSFVVRPFAFDVTATGNPAATGPSDPVFTTAGAEFTADVTALLWEAGDDLDNDGIADNHDDTDPSNNADLTDNAAAPNYGYEFAVEQVLLTAALDQPAGGANPGLAGGTSVTVFTAGTGTTTTVRYDEVGIIEMSAKVSDNDYLGIGATETAKITSKSGYVGRFNPAQYAVTAGDINPACSATFTYARQPFTGSMTIEAQNAAAGGNNRTENYRGAFVTLDPNAELVFINSATTTAYDSKSVTYNQNFDSGNYGEAVLALQFRWDMGEQVPTTSTVQNTGVTDEVNTLASAPVSIGSSPTRFGRAVVGTAAGSELVDLGVVMRTEYYLNSTSGYVVNSDDFCSIGAAMSLSNFADNLNAGETCVQDSGNPGLSGAGCTVAGPVLEQFNDPLLAGDANLFMRAPGAGNDGSANVDADVPAWLEFDWNTGVPGLEDPSGHIVFGIYGGDKNQVYRRELY